MSVWRSKPAASTLKQPLWLLMGIPMRSLTGCFSTLRLLPTLQSKELQQIALTHSSWSTTAGHSFGRLEFLGDSVLDLLAAEFLYNVEPPLNEGDMTKRRSELVKTDQLERYACKLDLLEHIQHRIYHADLPGFRKLLADSFEAYIGAYYLDAGLGAVRALVLPLFEEAQDIGLDNAKNQLQELVKSKGGNNPEYLCVSCDGTAHQPEFKIEVWCFGTCYGKGSASKKKIAEKQAAQQALVLLAVTKDVVDL